ncbi:hypothetical protein [Mesorhizobium sp.]|uniref:hypothetical protein n=1 Tax=Mesorhizobium sp. TaxID=1871066 RepID=UPI000FE94074|nr:hypothetical protein [Mesorhizobium sp.]RWE37434.1 MAG: hypothetical protein EOS77_02320 [Mesorhizobium sp.]
MPRTAEDIVRMEVHYCVSYLVSTLAGYTPRMSGYDDAKHDRDNKSLMDLTAQAQELASPIPDYEEAAIQTGVWEMSADGKIRNRVAMEDGAEYDTWQECCEDNGIEPYDRDVFEYWIVSNWLAEKLAAKGEKVDTDFAGMTVWARTTTGQAIAADWVIEQITADLNRA